MVCSSSAFFRFSPRICRAASLETPSEEPSSISACRTHLRNVSVVIPNRFDTVRIASHSEE